MQSEKCDACCCLEKCIFLGKKHAKHTWWPPRRPHLFLDGGMLWAGLLNNSSVFGLGTSCWLSYRRTGKRAQIFLLPLYYKGILKELFMCVCVEWKLEMCTSRLIWWNHLPWKVTFLGFSNHSRAAPCSKALSPVRTFFLGSRAAS